MATFWQKKNQSTNSI